MFYGPTKVSDGALSASRPISCSSPIVATPRMQALPTIEDLDVIEHHCLCLLAGAKAGWMDVLFLREAALPGSNRCGGNTWAGTNQLAFWHA